MQNFMRKDGQRRVVVTGMSIISSIGIGLDAVWDSILHSRSGIDRIQSFDPSQLNVQIAGEVNDFDPLNYMSKKQIRQLERSSQFTVAATQMALEDASLDEETLKANTEHISTMMGTAFGGFDALHQGALDLQNGKRPSPLALVASLSNMPTFYAAKIAHSTGYNSAITTACAAGTQAIGSGSELVRRGRTEIAVVGGVEAFITDYVIAAFDSMTSLARGYNDQPQAASRPFDADRSGFVYAEGCGILILESMEHAVKRNAKIYAEVVGHATSNDAYHITSIDPTGKGAERSMQWALDDAHLPAEAIGYINAHGTGTRLNDPIESAAICRVFQDVPPVSSTKSMTGHAIGAAGALEAVITILALQHQKLPPTINYTTPDDECPLDYVPKTTRDHTFQYALSNSFGLGGHNASIILGTVET